MKEFIRIFLVMVALVPVSNQVRAQQAYSLEQEPQLKVEGTSTIHDWEMVSSRATGTAQASFNDDGSFNITSLYVALPVKSLKSGKSQMDVNAYKALKADKFSEIRFELAEVLAITSSTIRATGKLTIAGTSRTITIEVKYALKDEAIQFSGTKSIKFSEFNIDPPTAIFGTIKTGDGLELSFNVIFKSTTKITKK
jgi:polyisoprenoid-binding protein YceI